VTLKGFADPIDVVRIAWDRSDQAG
jgi:hypothetical protein